MDYEQNPRHTSLLVTKRMELMSTDNPSEADSHTPQLAEHPHFHPSGCCWGGGATGKSPTHHTIPAKPCRLDPPDRQQSQQKVEVQVHFQGVT